MLVRRLRFACGVPHSDAADVDASEVLVIGLTAAVTHAPVESLFVKLEACHRGGIAASPASTRLGTRCNMLTMHCREEE